MPDPSFQLPGARSWWETPIPMGAAAANLLTFSAIRLRMKNICFYIRFGVSPGRPNVHRSIVFAGRSPCPDVSEKS